MLGVDFNILIFRCTSSGSDMIDSMDSNCVELRECKNCGVTSEFLKSVKNFLRATARFRLRYARIENRCDIWCRCCSIDKGMKSDVVADHVL